MYDSQLFINIQYPIIKTELTNANSKIIGIITASSILLSSFLVLFGILLTFTPYTLLWSCLFPSILLLPIISLIICIYGLRADYYNKSLKTLSKINVKVELFTTYINCTKEEFLKMFNNKQDDLDDLFLSQIYINGILCYKKYKIANCALYFLFPLYYIVQCIKG